MKYAINLIMSIEANSAEHANDLVKDLLKQYKPEINETWCLE